MKSKANRFALILAFAAIIAQILILFVYEPVTGKIPGIWVQITPAYFLLINLIVHFYLIRAAEKSAQAFVRTFMALTTVKMMISLIFLVIMALANKPDFKAPVLTFGVLYLLFMVLEVMFVIKDLKRLKNNG